MTNLQPPEGWRDRHDAMSFQHAIARLAYAEAEVLRAEEQLRIRAPKLDYWEQLYDWADEAFELLTALKDARWTRDHMAREVDAILIRWHDEDRKPMRR